MFPVFALLLHADLMSSLWRRGSVRLLLRVSKPWSGREEEHVVPVNSGVSKTRQAACQWTQQPSKTIQEKLWQRFLFDINNVNMRIVFYLNYPSKLRVLLVCFFFVSITLTYICIVTSCFWDFTFHVLTWLKKCTKKQNKIETIQVKWKQTPQNQVAFVCLS